MVADEALGRKRCAHRVSRSVRTSKTRMGLTRARLLWWVEFEAEKQAFCIGIQHSKKRVPAQYKAIANAMDCGIP